MAITKRFVQAAGLAVGAVGMVAACAPDSAVGRAARRLADRLGRDVRYAAATTPGIVYRLAGRQPDPNVSDDVLVDRIRSSLGPLEKRLDVPRVHVMVDDHVAILHGDVSDERDAAAIEHAIMRISGVSGVESHLHAGLVLGDTRPSQGAAVPQPPSAALRTLLDAAEDAGGGRAPRCGTRSAVRLCRPHSRRRTRPGVRTPAGRRARAGRSRHIGTANAPPRLRTLPQLVAAVTAEGGIDPQHAEEITARRRRRPARHRTRRGARRRCGTPPRAARSCGRPSRPAETPPIDWEHEMVNQEVT